MSSYKSIPVKVKLWFMNINPLNQSRGAAFINTIYLRQDIFDDYHSAKPNYVTISLLEHEKTHIERARQNGGVKFYIHYWLSKSFRFDEELAAIKAEMKIVKDKNKIFDVEKRAKYLSSHFYLWCASFENAQNKLKSIWRTL